MYNMYTYIYIWFLIYTYIYIHLYVYIYISIGFSGCFCWISRGLGLLDFLVYWVSNSNCIILNNLRAEGLREKCWMSWFLLNQGSNGETGLPEKLKQSETVGNSRKQSGAARHDQAKIVNPHCFLHKKKNPGNPLFFLKVQRETVGNSWGSYLWLGRKRAIIKVSSSFSF